jgi:hypothetical protein
VNTAELIETAVIENDLARECILHGVGTIGRGRRPFATARITSTEGTRKRGSVSFYYTPLGMLVCVAVGGLEDERGVYTLSLATWENGGYREIPCNIPPLYARGGYAWCSALTGKLTPSEVRNKTVLLKRLDGHNSEIDAMGTVRGCER